MSDLIPAIPMLTPQEYSRFQQLQKRYYLSLTQKLLTRVILEEIKQSINILEFKTISHLYLWINNILIQFM